MLIINGVEQYNVDVDSSALPALAATSTDNALIKVNYIIETV